MAINQASLAYQRCVHFVRLWLRLLCPVSVAGSENLPRAGAFLFACTHYAITDIPLFSALLYPILPRWLAKIELFKWFGWLMRFGKAIPVNRKKPGPSTSKAVMEILREGGTVAICPWGTRRRKGKEPKDEDGIAIFSLQNGVPIVPVAHRWQHWLPIGGVRIAIGEPIYPTISLKGMSQDEKKAAIKELLGRYTAASQALMKSIAD